MKMLEITGSLVKTSIFDSIRRIRLKVATNCSADGLRETTLKLTEESEIQSELEAAVRPARYAGLGAYTANATPLMYMN
jgi:hypothetical protein